MVALSVVLLAMTLKTSRGKGSQSEVMKSIEVVGVGAINIDQLYCVGRTLVDGESAVE